MTHVAAHYETVPLARRERDRLVQHGATQEKQALGLFEAFPERGFTRQDIERRFMWPTQTASRVLANLTSRGLLQKAGTAVSSFGRRCHQWRLRPAVPEQGRLFSA